MIVPPTWGLIIPLSNWLITLGIDRKSPRPGATLGHPSRWPWTWLINSGDPNYLLLRNVPPSTPPANCYFFSWSGCPKSHALSVSPSIEVPGSQQKFLGRNWGALSKAHHVTWQILPLMEVGSPQIWRFRTELGCEERNTRSKEMGCFKTWKDNLWAWT